MGLIWTLPYARYFFDQEVAYAAQLQDLIDQTEAELALTPNMEAFHDYVLTREGPPDVREADERMYQEWLAAREELVENLKAAKENPHAYASLGLDHWKEALYTMGGFRMTLTHNVQALYRDRIARLHEELELKEARLHDLKDRLERIHFRLEHIEGAEQALEIIETVHTAIEAYEGIKHGTTPEEAAAIIVASKALHAAITELADFARTQAIQAEGYNTLEDLMEDIERRVDAVNQTAGQLDYSERVVKHAEEVYAQPHRGRPRS